MSSKSFAPIIFILAILGCINSGRAQSRTIADQADSAMVMIKLSDIQREYERITTEAPQMVSSYADSSLINSINTGLLKTSQNFKNLVFGADEILSHYLRSWQILNLRNKLNRANSNFETLSNSASTAAVNIERSLSQIEKEKMKWNALRERADPDQVLIALLPQIEEVLILLNHSEGKLRVQLTRLLAIQNELNAYENEVAGYIERVNEAERLSIKRLFERDSVRPWAAGSDSLSNGHLRLALSGNLRQGVQESVDYLAESKNTFIGLSLVGIFLLSLILYLRKSTREEEAQLDSILTKSSIANYPISATLIILLLIAILTLKNQPTLFTEILLLQFSFPIIIYSWNKTVQNRWIYWVIILLYALDVILQHIPLTELGRFILTLLSNATTIGLLYWMQTHRDKYLDGVRGFLITYLKVFLVPIYFLLATASFVLELVGYSALARLLLTGISTTLYIGPIILICLEIAITVLVLLRKSTFLNQSRLLEKYLPDVFQLLKFGAVFLWFRAALRAFGLSTTVHSWLLSIWNFGGSFGILDVTIGDVVGTLGIIILSIVISNIVRVLLEEEIFLKFNVPRGVPMAMGVLGKYTIVIIGFFLAIASVGFDLAKMSIVAGALGVGVGFGLQNLVSNFVSGLILIFERPILVGDVIAAEGVEGTVSEIGIRSSKVLTYAGAEVIIPNANLVSSNVSNWTMTDRSRRFTIDIRAHVKGNPEEIVKVIQDIAMEHPCVIESPSPFVVFEGQLEQVLLFRLYYWQTGEILATRGELNVRIYAALRKMGIEISIPTYEIKAPTTST